MSIIRLWGGLGNQMFQYAFGQWIAAESGRQTKWDLHSGFANDVYRRCFALSQFNTKIVAAESREIPIGMAWPSPWHRLAKTGWSVLPRCCSNVVYERRPFQFDKAIAARATDGMYYFGYWQHDGYLATIQDRLRKEFTLREPLPRAGLALVEEMAGCDSISVHIRRYNDRDAKGQLIERARRYHGVCASDYYQQAVERIGTRPEIVCYIFTDDPQWVKANLAIPATCRYVSELCPCSDVEEMILMASCQNHVISNSSFSWWGAWLGRNPNRVVVAPRLWRHGIGGNVIDICPKTWIKL
jgi:hypothetical protein